MEFPTTHLKTLRYYLRVIFAYAIFMALLTLVNGCSSHQRSTSQQEMFEFEKTGIASFYAKKHQYRTTASGETFNNNSLTAAHRTLPFGTQVLVTNTDNGKSVKVTINDRGPFVRGRIIDLSRAAFSEIADITEGVASVEVTIVK